MGDDLHSVSNWGVRDPRPDEPLESIWPLSIRALALLARNVAKPILQTDFVQAAGAVTMLKGLDYHRDRFVEIIGQLATGALQSYDTALHEAVAYVNRAGQFYYFATSKLVTERGERPPIPKFEALIPFRHKHTAHRSIDKPISSDTRDLQAYQAISMNLDGRSFHPRDGATIKATLETALFPLRTGYLVFQISLGEGNYYFLNIERDHEALMLEAYAVLEAVLR